MLLVQYWAYCNANNVTLFQYIICCWFKDFVVYAGLANTNFNTLYVVGSRFEAPNFIFLSGFQYIICCWFKRLNMNNFKLINNFNTLYVVGSIYP